MIADAVKDDFPKYAYVKKNSLSDHFTDKEEADDVFDEEEPLKKLPSEYEQIYDELLEIYTPEELKKYRELHGDQILYEIYIDEYGSVLRCSGVICMYRKSSTIRDAAKIWVSQFDSIDSEIIARLMKYEPDKWREITIPAEGDIVYVDRAGIHGEIIDYDRKSGDYRIRLQSRRSVVFRIRLILQ